MYKINCNQKNGLLAGEYAWEVMEQSDVEGEIPLRIVVSPSYIRTLTSLYLTVPTDVKEIWRVTSSDIIKVSWCPQLCVLSILYKVKNIDKEVVKVFLASNYVGHKIMKTYKKMKPVAVHLSPSRAFVSRRNEKLISTSFKLPEGQKNEKFWRVVYYPDDLTPKEVFFGLCAAGFRLIDPSNHEILLVVDSINMIFFRHFSMFDGNIIKIKYMEATCKSKTKKRRLMFEIHPAVGKDIMAHFQYCTTHGDDFKEFEDLPKFKIPEELASPKPSESTTHRARSKSEGVNVQFARSHSEGTIKKKPIQSETTDSIKSPKSLSISDKPKELLSQTPNTTRTFKGESDVPPPSEPPKSKEKSTTSKKSKAKLIVMDPENKENIAPEISGLKSGIKKNNENLMKFKDPQLKVDNPLKSSKKTKGIVKL